MERTRTGALRLGTSPISQDTKSLNRHHSGYTCQNIRLACADSLHLGFSRYNRISAEADSGDPLLNTSGKAIARYSIRSFAQESAEAWDAVADPLAVFDENREIAFLNAAATRFLEARGLPGNIPELASMLRVCDPATQAEIPHDRLPVSRTLRGETVNEVEYLVRPAPRGACFWVACSARPLYANDGRIQGVVLLFRDITARKKREFEVESASQLRDFIYQGNLAGIARTAVDGRIIDCNDALVRMLGYSSVAELRTTRAQQLYWDAADRDKLLLHIVAEGSVHEAELCLRRRDQSRCWVMINTRMIDAEPGEVGGTLVSTIVDITERKNHEEILRQSEARFTAFMRYFPGVAFIKDLDGNYVFYNEASWQLFAKRPEEIPGKTDEDLWTAEDAARHRSNDASVIATGKLVQFVETTDHADGLHYWLVYKFPIMEDGRLALVGGIGIDITERRNLEEQLTQARKMEALGRLAGGVAHDFNNLLTVIAGYGQLALESVESAPPERVASYIQEIINSARRASGMTGQLLAFGRRQVVEPRVVDLAELLDNIEPLLRRMIGEHVDIRIRASRGRCLVKADVHQIEQVLMNLAGNARDAMPLGGLLEIECRILPESIERPGLPPLSVLMEVRDNGIGMDVATRARIFEPFFTSKEKGKGTGLGLSTVYGIVAQAGGDIQVESELNEGTRFRVYFPLAGGEDKELPRPPSDAAPVGLETVLLVEDEPGVRALAETVLKKLGYKVLVADDGEAALAIWNQHRASIDVVLTDVIMPKMNGGELAQKLREMSPRLKILFMSGYTDDMIAGHGVLNRETQLIQKPFTADILARKLRSVLDS